MIATPPMLQATPLLALQRARTLSETGRRRWLLDLICQRCATAFQRETFNRCDPPKYCGPECVSLAAIEKAAFDTQARFWRHVDLNGPVPEACPEIGPCWVWTLTPTNWGYGRFVLSGGKRVEVLAHRYSYESQVGSVGEGLELDHLCRNRRCVRPSHLEPVTHQVNVLRGTSMSARNARKTHCLRGHDLSDSAITLITKTGARDCRICTAEIGRRTRARRAAQARDTHNAVCRWRGQCSTCSDLAERVAKLEARNG